MPRIAISVVYQSLRMADKRKKTRWRQESFDVVAGTILLPKNVSSGSDFFRAPARIIIKAKLSLRTFGFRFLPAKLFSG